MKTEERLQLRRQISAIIWGCDTRDASFIAERIVKHLVKDGWIK